MIPRYDSLLRTYTENQKRFFNNIDANSITILPIYLGIFHSEKYRLYLKTSNMHRNRTQKEHNPDELSNYRSQVQ